MIGEHLGYTEFKSVSLYTHQGPTDAPSEDGRSSVTSGRLTLQRKLGPPVDAHRCEQCRYVKTLLGFSAGTLEVGNPKKRSSETKRISESML